MVQEGSGGRFCILDEELSLIVGPDFGVTSTDNFGFEGDAKQVGVRSVAVRTIGETTDSENGESGEISVDWIEVVGTGGFEVRYETEVVR